MTTEKISTYCAMCTSRCGVIATVEDGVFSKVTADPDHPNGCICIKGSAAPEMVYSPDRLRQPMKRTRPKGDADPGWEAITWEEALRTITKKLTTLKAESGAESVVFGCATTAGAATEDMRPWLERLTGLFGTPNYLAPGHVCTWNRTFGSKFTYGAPTPRIDLDRTNTILLWGVNPQATEPASAMRISKAMKRGAKLIVIDPREHALAKKADCWLRVRPGSDGALALAMTHVLFDENLYDEAFLRDWTNGPLLVRGDTGALLTAADIDTTAPAEDYVVWQDGAPVTWNGHTGTTAPETALFGAYDVPLTDGTTVSCHTAAQALRDLAAAYAPELSADITWVAAEDVRRAARLFATNLPSGYESWTGTEMHSDAMQMNRAIHCFFALTGQFDAPGSNVEFAAPQVRPVSAGEFLTPEQDAKRLGLAEHPFGPPRDPGLVQHSRVYRAILDGEPYKVRGLVLFGSNVLIGHVDPDRGRAALEALDFYVHIDMFDNPGAAYADILLPASTTWESPAARASFRGDGNTWGWGQYKAAAAPPQHDSRPDMDIIFDLAARLGYGAEFFGGDQDAAWDHHLSPAGFSVDALRAQPSGMRADVTNRTRKYAETDPATGKARGFATPTGRMELYATAFPAAGYDPLPRYSEPVDSPMDKDDTAYPLVLTSFRTMAFIGPQNRNTPRLRAREPDPFMEIHPDTAAAAGISDGDWALVENANGRARLKARFTPSIHPRVICAPYGWWQHCTELDLPGHDAFGPDGANLNRLVPDADIDPISASVPHRSRMCRVVALATD
ncbi:MAG: anaerobic selenocysteine-containing dehydrogenase [Paracoccaceae bacterium]|jgi:anaerobic selenocysteine-containing dehydrogenase